MEIEINYLRLQVAELHEQASNQICQTPHPVILTPYRIHTDAHGYRNFLHTSDPTYA